MENTRLLVIYLIIFASSSVVFGEGDHAHVPHSDGGTGSPTGSVTTVTTTSGGTGNQDTFSSILANLNPELVGNLARNPQIAGLLRSQGIDPGQLTAAKAAADAGGSVQPPPSGGGAYNYPPPPGGRPPFGGGLGGFGLPFFGPYKNFHVSGDFGFNYPIVEKVIVIVGGGILLLVILALLTKAFAKGGLFYDWGSSFAEALSGSASVDVGPFHKSVAGAAAVNAGVGAGGRPQQFAPTPQNMQMTQRVYDGIDQKF